jgi:hypothetical protein
MAAGGLRARMSSRASGDNDRGIAAEAIVVQRAAH